VLNYREKNSMTKEELLNLLHEKGLDDEAIKVLCEDIVKGMNPEETEEEKVAAKEEAEKKEASKLLGVDL
jgi:streptomycin 6-kinase